MLKECNRVLKPGGKIRISTPDLETIVSLYVQEDKNSKSELQDEYIRWIVDMRYSDIGIYSAVFAMNIAFLDWGHRFLYDRKTLQRVLEEAQFTDINRFESGISSDEALSSIEAHGKNVGNVAMDSFETMILEATSPG